MTATTVPHLDKHAVTVAALAAIDKVLNERAADDMTGRLRAVSELANTEQATADRLRPLRDGIALSLALYDGVRTLHRTLGITRTRFYEMRCDKLQLTPAERAGKWLEGPGGESAEQRRARIAARAAEVGVRRYTKPNPNWLLDVSTQVAVSDETAAVARAARDQLVGDFLARGCGRQEIADLIGRSVTRVTRIKAKTPQPA